MKTRNEIIKFCKRQKGKIGFTSGAFDLFHAGHADYLEKAKKKCDILVVGVNSDVSIKKYKGPTKPLIPEAQRIKIIRALRSVGYAFLFDEANNKKNIELLQPDFYIKAGDYTKKTLSSAKYLPKHGKVILIRPTKGVSSTEIIQKILNPTKLPKKKPAVFLDRDGVINKNVHFLHEPKKFKLLPKVIEGLKKLKNYRLVIVTNQCGIGLGYYTKEDFFKVNSKMLKELSKHGIMIDKIYFCPHSHSEKCGCRKPKPGMIQQAQKELNINMGESWIIGDMPTDITAGKRAGIKTILISKGKADHNAKNLKEAAKIITGEEQK